MANISVITPVHDPPRWVIEATAASVFGQSLADWQWCIVDDGSADREVQRLLEDLGRDPRVSLHRHSVAQGISVASNAALDMAEAPFVALLDHDDLLAHNALERVIEALGTDETVDYLYTDEDKVDPDGRHFDAFCKPAWSPERLRTQMYTCHLSVLRTSRVREVGGFRPELDGSQDWDLVLRVTERGGRVVHVPEVLYHWRVLPTSTASAPTGVKDYAFEAGRRAIQEHCDRVGLEGAVEHDRTRPSVYRIRPRLQRDPLVSIVIPTRGTVRQVRGRHEVLVEHCIRSVIERSTYRNYEIVVVADAGTAPDVLARLGAHDEVRVVEYDRPFNFSTKINVGAAVARGEQLLILNDDIEVVTEDWIETLLMYSMLEGVGAVGAKLLYEDGRIQHAGVGFDKGGPGHLFLGCRGDFSGYFDQLHVTSNLLAITGACIMTSRDAFEAVGGLSPLLPVNFGDIDYCLKLRHLGRRVVLCPDAVLLHFESSTRDAAVHVREIDALRQRWREHFAADPYIPQVPGATSFGFAGPLQRPDGRLLDA